MSRRRPQRLPWFDYCGFRRYFLTMCTAERSSYFTEAEAVQLVCTSLRHSCRRHDFAVLAYCFMPDHLHLLVEGTSMSSDLRLFCVRFRQRAGFHWKRSRAGSLWQEGYHERVLREDEPTGAVVRYILNNPVRAGLVDRPEVYPFWGSLERSREELAEFVALEGSGGRRDA